LFDEFAERIPIERAARRYLLVTTPPRLGTPDQMRSTELNHYLHQLRCAYANPGGGRRISRRSVVTFPVRICPMCRSLFVAERKIETCGWICGRASVRQRMSGRGGGSRPDIAEALSGQAV
jgi:hypothetical protein